ncbi:MAG: heparan-alpha-glucosaminide N-acetyltransferase domain-containing protein, partial [Polyangiales bacterium]
MTSPSPSPASHPPAAAARWRAIDLLRFVAVLLMVQGHAFSALVSDGVRQAHWFRYHRYVHGFTAPLFFFASGLAFMVATWRKWPAHTAWGPVVQQRLGRYGWLLFIGYMLHLPGLRFSPLFGQDAAQAWRAFTQVDALHHIGMTLILAELSILVLRRRRWTVSLWAGVGLAAVLAGPWVWRWPAAQHLPLPLAAYANADTGSLFPLVPWCGFVFAGMLTARAYQGLEGRLDARAWALPWATLAFALLLLWLARRLQLSGVNPFGPHNYWKTSPIFFLTRYAYVLLALGGLSAGEAWLSARRTGAPPSWAARQVQQVGQETLVIYVVHLLVLYGSPVNPGLWRLYRHSL